MKIIITNKIEEKVREYQFKHNVSKTWIAEQLDMTPQNMYKIFKSNTIHLETLIKFSIVLDCDMRELFDVIVE